MPIVDTRQIDAKEPLPGWPGRFFNSETMTFGYYDTVEGAHLHEHAHPNEEVWHVIDGELEIVIAGETHRASAGSVAVVPPNTPHSVNVITPGKAIVVDHPRRESIGGVRTD